MEDIFQEDSDYGASSYDDAAGRAAGRNSQISLIKDYIVTDIAEHPDFDADRLLNDISVLKLQKPIELTTSDRVNAACMPGCQNMFDNTFNNGTGVRCWVAGEFFFLGNCFKGTSINDVPRFLAILDLPIYLPFPTL